MSIKNSIEKNLDRTILFVLGIFCFLYSISASNFAELHIKLPFLNFPIFVGEILLAFCIIMLLAKWKLSSIKFNRWHYLLFAYIIFILLKAFYGYFKWGPLAFRHSALFYYPLFAVIGYYFYNKQFFKNNKVSLFLLVILIFTALNPNFYSYFRFTFFMLILLLSLKYKLKIIKYSCLFLLLAFFPYEQLFATSRSGLVANLAGILVFFSLLFLLLKIKLRYKVLAVSLSFILMASGIFLFADKNALKTLTNWNEIINKYKEKNVYISQQEKIFEFTEIKPRIYAKNIAKDIPAEDRFSEKELVNLIKPLSEEKKIILEDIFGKKIIQQIILFPKSEVDLLLKNISDVKSSDIEKIIAEAYDLETKRKSPEYRNLGTAYQNTNFRLFIWRDMLSELFAQKPIFGFDFGKPLRSKSIEILNWGYGTWSPVGWITPHNSYLHIIYRSGIIGILLIFAMFFMLLKKAKVFILSRSLNGIILFSILIYWLTIANFLVILELPYNAIPFWSLFGVTFKVYTDIRK